MLMAGLDGIANKIEAGIGFVNELFDSKIFAFINTLAKIGDLESLKKKFVTTRTWAEQEQQGSSEASLSVLQALALGNETYENRFGYIFIVCATGKKAEEMLSLLEQRLKNDSKEEIKVAAAEQDKITKIRLEKLIHE